MAVDKNVIGLSLQLDLESTAATSAIEAVGQKAIEVQSQVNAAMQSAMSGIAGSTGDAGSSLNSAISASKNLGKAGSAMAKGMNPYLSAHDAAVGLHEDEIGRLATYKDSLKQLISLLEGKNKVHDKELGLVTDEVAMAGQLGDRFGDVGDNVEDSERALARVRQVMMAIWTLVKEVDQATENFVTTNYRAYGSMQQLANEARYLQTDLGVTNEVAMSTIKALADVRTPIDQMDKLGKTVAKANRTTGVAVETIAGYSLYLRNLGLNAEGTEKQINFMTDAMRKYGLTQNDVNTLMSRSGMQALNMARLFGGSAEELAKFEKTRIAMAAVGKEVGITAAELEGFYDHLSNNVGAMQQFGALSGMVIRSADDFNVAMIKGGMALDKQLASLEARAAAGDPLAAQQLIATEEALAEAHFGGSVAALRASREMGKLAKEMNLAGDSAEDFAKIMEATQKKAMDPFDESNQSLTAQLRILSETISGTLMPFIQLLADGLMYVVMAINMVIKPLAYMIKLFGQFLNLIGSIPIIGTALKFIIGLAGALGLLVAGMVAFGVAVTGFSISVGLFGRVIAGAQTLVTSFAQMMMTVARAIGQSVVILLQSIGQGLLALGNAVRPVIGPLLGLALAVTLVGIGMYFLGMGVALVAEQGWMAIAAIIAMTAAMITAVTALAIIAYVAGPVVPLIVALAFAVLLLGAAAMLAGVGFYLIGLSIEAVATYGIQAAAAISALIVPVLLLGLAGLAAAPGLLLLGLAMMTIALPAIILAYAFAIVVRALEVFVKLIPKIGDAGEALLYFAAMVLASVAILLVAGLLMIPAAIAMMVGAVMFTAAGIALFAAGVVLAIGGTALLVAAVIVAAAAVILLPAAVAVFTSGLLILLGGTMLLLGAISILTSASVLIAASAALIVAGFALLVALLVFSPAAAYAVVVGAEILFAGVAMLVGAISLYYAAEWLHAGSTIMKEAAVLFHEAMELMLPASALSVIVGYLLLAGAIRIISASAMLFISGVLLLLSAVMIFTAAVMLVPASILLGFGSVLLTIASLYLSVAAVVMGFAADLLLPSAITLFKGAVVTLGASLMLLYAGMILIPAAMLLTIGIFALIWAVSSFLLLSDKIFKVGIGMKLLAQGFTMLANAPLSGFKAAAQAALSAMPTLKKLAGELDVTAVQLQAAADKFTKPADQIAQSLNNLSESLANLGQGLDLASQIGELAVLLDQYSQLLELTAQRVEIAVAEKAQPAISTARDSGLADAVRAETIDTVQVKSETEGETQQIDSTTTILMEQNELLRNILEAIGGYDGSDLSEITSLLRDGMDGGNASGGLANELNQWMK